MSPAGTLVYGARLRGNEYQCARCGRFATWSNSRAKPSLCGDCAGAPTGGFREQPWADQALCAQVGPDVFFPAGPNNRAAKAVCARCPVVASCLDFALATGPVAGVWGGLSAAERRNLMEGGAA